MTCHAPNTEPVFVDWSIDDERADTANHRTRAAPTTMPAMTRPTNRPSHPLAWRRLVARLRSGSAAVTTGGASEPTRSRAGATGAGPRASESIDRRSSTKRVERLLTWTE